MKALLTTIPCPALTLAADDPAFTDHDVVITVTSSRDVLFDAQPSPKRLVIGVGAYRPDMVEVGPMIVAGRKPPHRR
ncbi:ornithine cyclodeaminase [Gluconobacter morbifer G707]|uniref:Ornithine cyclodeaminase n=1 Tax=Gluconobacter morbifer G707 TaxID=1088869 RepID=G6XL60_9PROT|nr:ornithine cyclodeaminase [Gluconobacter morbifer G707]